MSFLRRWQSRPGYRWVIIVLCFLLIMVCLGFCSSTKGLYLSAITEAMGLERSLFTVSDSLCYIATAVTNLFFGSLVIRFGPRKLIGCGFLCLIASMLISSVANSLPVFYLGGFMLGAGQSFTSTSIVGYVVGLWCRENKGTIMGAILAANGVGGAVAAQIISPFINGSTFGYRTAYQISAWILLVVGVLVVALFQDAPQQAPTAVSPAKKQKSKGWYGVELKQCLKMPAFYGMLIYMFFGGLVIQSASGIYPSHLKDVGMAPAFATAVVSVFSLCLSATKFMTGVLYDRLGLRFAMLTCNIASAIAMVLLALVSGEDQAMAMVFAVVYAIGTPLQTILLPLLTADMFGDRDGARIMGITVSVSTAGYALGTPLVNLFYDIQGTYKTVLLLMAVIMVVVTIVSILSYNASQKLRYKIEQQLKMEEK